MKEFKSGHICNGPVTVEVEFRPDGKAVMIEQDCDIVSLEFEEIDALIAHLLELKERHNG